MNFMKFYYKISKAAGFSRVLARTRWQTLTNAGIGKSFRRAGKTASSAPKTLFFQQCRSEFTGISCIIQPSPLTSQTKTPDHYAPACTDHHRQLQSPRIPRRRRQTLAIAPAVRARRAALPDPDGRRGRPVPRLFQEPPDR